MRTRAHLLVMAKAPVAGRVKTRLMRAMSAQQAADIAEAALHDTLTAVAGCASPRRILALDGDVGSWLPAGFDVVEQRGTTFNDRLAAAWRHAGAPGLQIGMDTPQVSSALLDESLQRLHAPGVDAVLGPAADGGWWAIGFRAPAEGAFDGVPMSACDTGELQLARLRELGLRVALLPELRDIDEPEDLAEVARQFPHLRVAAVAQEAIAI